MVLRIETFSNLTGGNAFYKAVCHPLAGRKAAALIADLAGGGPLAVYDPLGYAEAFAAIYDLARLEIANVFVQDLDDLGKTRFGQVTQPVTDLPGSAARRVLVMAFDAERSISHIEHLVPAGAEVLSLDRLRLPAAMLTNSRRYLDGLNFATNFAFFREAEGQHTRVVTCNYWAGYGAAAPGLWCCLFDAEGSVLAEWDERLTHPGGVVIDSAAVRARFGLGAFTGQLFIHATHVAGHDIVKYALDTYGDDPAVLSCTHDANAWPSDLYAGLPAPAEDERVVLWLQNSHPVPIPPGSIGFNLMGADRVAWLDQNIPPFGSHALDTRKLLPDARWPQQIEVQAGKHMVRPRYEVFKACGRSRIAHVNVERGDLKPDPRIPELSNLMGKGYILPAPVLPPQRFRSIVLPTPMATRQATLPIAARIYNAAGREVAVEAFGNLPRDHETTLDASDALNAGGNGGGVSGKGAAKGDGAKGEGANGEGINGKRAWAEGSWGHVELVYDFANGGAADGWLHGLFRYEDRLSGHAAETSFGAHMFNSVLTYKGEPQSYAGRPPGLSTRLFLRIGPPPYETLCHLIYPASTPWHVTSATNLVLNDGRGRVVAERAVAIPCGGSLLWRVSEMFSDAERATAGDTGYLVVRDARCRLFGYHGLMNGDQAFSFDHMFGF